ncbi:MAG: 16S rRNA methyltransferase [Treponema sp.]|jgi:16S rRNA (cytosine1407-C5)-methyltransferase|nr:16S rRNA methyltransferase [Treponema sp.]
MNSKEKGPPVNRDFEDYYIRLYGSRWEGLRQSLLRESPAFSFETGLKAPYLLNYASVLAALSLRLPGEGIVLDACAAPGGKSLVLAAALGENVTLLSNEFSRQRRRRLEEVLNAHLPEETRRRVRVSGFDAAALGGKKNEQGRFQAILLDAPCSSEAHVLGKATALAEWTPARPRFLARRQWALLSSAFLLLAPGGSLVYSTCALTEEENDGVARRLPEKYGAAVIPDAPDFTEGEKTAFGRIILPDVCGGLGPMYVARFGKGTAYR